MVDPSQFSRFRVLVESALRDYQNQTGTTLTSHSLAKSIQGRDSVESITAVLQEQARPFRKFRRGDGRITKSLERVVSVLYTVSNSTSLGDVIGLVRRKLLMGAPRLMVYSAAIPTCKGHIYRHCHPSRCMAVSLFPMRYSW